MKNYDKNKTALLISYILHGKLSLRIQQMVILMTAKLVQKNY